jgi:sugar transferase (PEP-CTERM system associated)
VIRILNAHFPSRTLFLGISEACLVSLCFVSASVAQLGASNTSLLFSYDRGSLKIAVAAAAFIACMYCFDLYDSSIMNDRRRVLIRMLEALGTMYILLAALYFFYPTLGLGRRIFPIGFTMVVILLLLWRNLFSTLNSVPHFAERALIVGDGPLVELLEHELESRRELGVRIVGHIAEGSESDYSGSGRDAQSSSSAAAITCENLSRAVELLRVNRIFIVMGERRGKLPVEFLLSLKCHGVVVQEGTEVYEAITGKVPIESIRLSWLLFAPSCRTSHSLLTKKRIADIMFSIVGLLLSLPLLPFIVLAIALTSGSPILYRQKRAGRDGLVFDCYKFRTMHPDAEADTGPTWAADEDPRITPIGRFLRQSRMDEIPQLWNVLKGDMSLVGPRPERPEFVQSLARDIPHYTLRQAIRPGITGWAQIRYKYGNSVEDSKEKLSYDLFYIKNMSFGLDVFIFFSTLKVILLRRGAK